MVCSLMEPSDIKGRGGFVVTVRMSAAGEFSDGHDGGVREREMVGGRRVVQEPSLIAVPSVSRAGCCLIGVLFEFGQRS